MILYLDYAATTPLNIEVKKYIIDILGDYGNPSSIYELGNKTKQYINHARNNIYKFINANQNNDIIFTSSGSASNTLAIKGLTNSIQEYILYYSPIAHKSMILSCQSCKYNHELLIDTYGNIRTDWLEKKLKDNNETTNIVCIEVANSEIGLIRDIKNIIKLVHKYNGIVIGDFTGYIPNYPVDVTDLDIDIATFSGHKLGALKGVGILYKKHDIELFPIIYGSQEQGLFAGTENVIGIASIGKAVEVYDYSSITSNNRDYVYQKLIKEISNCYLIGSLKDRLPHNLYMCFPGISGNDLVALLDLDNIQVSTGSACNNGDLKPSNTLLKMKINSKDINSCIRITFSGNETKDELDYLCNRIKTDVNMLKIK